MKSLRHILLCSIFFFNNAPIASEVDNSYQKQSLLAVLYKRTSAEYKANTFQVYSSAKNNIDKAVRNIPNVKCTDVNHFSAFDIIKYKKIIFNESSFKELEKRYN